jgi:hypothetical protein
MKIIILLIEIIYKERILYLVVLLYLKQDIYLQQNSHISISVHLNSGSIKLKDIHCKTLLICCCSQVSFEGSNLGVFTTDK